MMWSLKGGNKYKAPKNIYIKEFRVLSSLFYNGAQQPATAKPRATKVVLEENNQLEAQREEGAHTEHSQQQGAQREREAHTEHSQQQEAQRERERVHKEHPSSRKPKESVPHGTPPAAAPPRSTEVVLQENSQQEAQREKGSTQNTASSRKPKERKCPTRNTISSSTAQIHRSCPPREQPAGSPERESPQGTPPAAGSPKKESVPHGTPPAAAPPRSTEVVLQENSQQEAQRERESTRNTTSSRKPKERKCPTRNTTSSSTAQILRSCPPREQPAGSPERERVHSEHSWQKRSPGIKRSTKKLRFGVRHRIGSCAYKSHNLLESEARISLLIKVICD